MAISFQMSEMDSEMKALRNKDRIVLNVGGVKHETFKSTLRNFPDTRLAWTVTDNFSDYDEEKNEYFFDRHPGVFQQIINFYRTGKLHCPSDVCGPLFEEELNFWGIDEKQMEPCCWSTYTLHREAQENLKVFEGPDFNDSDSEMEPEEWKNGETSEQHRSSNTPAWQQWRSRVWTILDDHTSSKIAKIYVWISLVFVVVSVTSLCADTDSHVQENSIGKMVIKVIDIVCGIWFTAEFIMRCATCPNIVDFSKQSLNWIDFIAIIPFYLNFILGDRNIVSEILVLGRMLRLLRFFNKMSLGFQILKHTLVASTKEMFLLLLLLMIPVLIFAGILHLCESGVTGTKFKSIPEAFWWAIITLTTVGYGDMAPMTTQGKIFGSVCAAVSMLISALPISIIGANFSLYYRHAQAKLKLPKKPRKVLIGAANSLLRRDQEDEPENSERNSSDDLTTEVYLGPKKPRRERMSLFCNGVVTPRNNSRLRSLGSDNLPGQTNRDIDENGFNLNSPDNHKSSLLSTSTKSTTVDSPPPRSVSFPANLPGRDKHVIFEPASENGVENSAYRKDCDDITPRAPNGSAIRSSSAGSRYKRNGVIHPVNAPRVTVTAEVVNENALEGKPTGNINNSESEHNLHVPSRNHDERTDGLVSAPNQPLTAEG